MGTFSNMVNRFSQFVNSPSPKNHSTSPSTFWSVNNVYGTGKIALEKDPTIFSVVSRLSSIVASIDVSLYDGADVKQRADNIHRLVAREPNPNYSAYELWHKAEVDRNEFGNAYIFIQYDALMQPTALWNMERGYVTPFINSDDNTLWYQVQGVKGAMFVPAMQMIHLKHATGASRLMGISPIDVLQGSADYNDAFNKFSLNEMSKRDGFTIKFDKNVDNARKAAVAKNIQQFIKDNSGVLFSEPGVEVDTIDRKIATSDVSKNDDTYIRRVANAFNVPLLFLNTGEQGSGYRDSEEHLITFVTGTILPIVRQYEAELNMKMLTDEQKDAGFYFKFNTNTLLRGNTAARTALYQVLLRGGAATPGQIAEMEGLPRVDQEGVNSLWISGDLYPLSATPEERKGVTATNVGKESNDVLPNEDDDE
ncbi:phage portal protein [Weissella confusa]|nr:phage portal protein [Weissella confusa]